MKEFVCYTDGSFNNSNETHGGIVFWDNGTYASRIHVYSNQAVWYDMRNVGGELIAAYSAILSTVTKVKKLNEESMENYRLTLVYDYRGVGNWITGAWKAKKPATIWYRDNVKKLLEEVPNLSLNLVWIKGHGDCRGNNEADRVAEYTMGYALRNNIPICQIDEIMKV